MCALTFVGYFAGVYTAGRCMERCKKKKERMKRRVRLKNWQIRRSDVIGVSVISVPVVVRLKNEIAPVSPRRYHRRQSWHIKQNDNFVLATRTIWLNRLPIACRAQVSDVPFDVYARLTGKGAPNKFRGLQILASYETGRSFLSISHTEKKFSLYHS